MNNILRDEVNQHTSDEVAKVLEELEAQGVDLTAIKEALANTGSSGMKVKSIQKGRMGASSGKEVISIASVNPDNCVILLHSPSGCTGSSGSGDSYVYIHSLTSDTLVLYFTNHSVQVHWHVIEFE